MIAYSVDQPDWARQIEVLAIDAAEKMALVAEAIGVETIAYFRSLTNEMRPPARVPGTKATTGVRRAHPGHWADVTGQLAASYDHEVERVGKAEVVLSLKNYAEYAAHLEARDGFFVLSGVTDPGGPVEQALRRAVAKHAPGWEIRRG
jgi:hypothetical protein